MLVSQLFCNAIEAILLCRAWHIGGLGGGRGLPQCLGMTDSMDLASVRSDYPAPFTDQLRLAVAAYLARFKGSSREHIESDLRCYLSWCATRGLDPLAARRPHLELYIRWMQEIRRFKPSTVSRRFSVAAEFYRTCVIDGILEHSPAEHVRRPAVPAESPTLGFTHLPFEALLTAARQPPSRYDFALLVMLGLLGLRIFEATGANIADLGEEHGHRVLRVCGRRCCNGQEPLSWNLCGAAGGSCPVGARSDWQAGPEPQQLVGGAAVGSLALAMAVAGTRM